MPQNLITTQKLADTQCWKFAEKNIVRHFFVGLEFSRHFLFVGWNIADTFFNRTGMLPTRLFFPEAETLLSSSNLI